MSTLCFVSFDLCTTDLRFVNGADYDYRLLPCADFLD